MDGWIDGWIYGCTDRILRSNDKIHGFMEQEVYKHKHTIIIKRLHRSTESLATNYLYTS